MHPAGGHHLTLGRVPERVMGLPQLELLERIEEIPMVATMLIDALQRPGRKPLHPVIVHVVPAEVIRKFPPHNQFFQKGIAGYGSADRTGGLQRHPLGGDLAEMEPG